jgi:hypothetical protein
MENKQEQKTESWMTNAPLYILSDYIQSFRF